ncbi:disulfide bond formation protein B [Burkholderia ubonensis]|uniref:disulfide bond formation protein B n=1 Tax=Burkholderia ubonensis TaxID=101571 RepID=UPI0007561572|nr:disulfide bond formation protein B [Burkholderia ubonensis]KVP40067.1 hypothetical protein WJ87_07750 [Burkholderia ubonensis]
MKRSTLLNLGIAGLSFGAVAAAGILQSAWHLQPCTMCIVQRYAFLVVGLLAFSRVVVEGRVAMVTRIASFLGAIIGILASLRVQWAISVPSATCGRDKLAAFLNNLPWVDAWPSMFEATGVCGDPVPPVLGFQFHAWSFALFVVVLLLTWLSGRHAAAPSVESAKA